MADLPDEMRAVVVPTPGGPEVLTLTTRPRPSPARARSSIRVAAAGVNRPDVLQRQGNYRAAAGRLRHPRPRNRRRGRRARRRRVALQARRRGDGAGRPAAATPNIASSHETNALPVPAGLSHDRGGGDPRDVLHGLDQCVRPRRAESAASRLLVHGGASGIGTTAIQLAKAFGAKVIATVGSTEKAKALRAARRRSRRQLSARGLRRRDASGDRRQGRRRHPRHGRRRLCRAQLRRRGGRRAHRPDRVSARAARSRSISAPLMMKRLHPHRLDAAAALGRREGGDRRAAASEGLAAAGARPLQARDRFRPFRSTRPPRRIGAWRARPFRQDRADALNADAALQADDRIRRRTDFAGWQRQENGALDPAGAGGGDRAARPGRPRVAGAGRTDAGVHARGQVAHVDLAREWAGWRLSEAINAHLAPRADRRGRRRTGRRRFRRAAQRVDARHYRLSRRQPPRAADVRARPRLAGQARARRRGDARKRRRR